LLREWMNERMRRGAEPHNSRPFAMMCRNEEDEGEEEEKLCMLMCFSNHR